MMEPRSFTVPPSAILGRSRPVKERQLRLAAWRERMARLWQGVRRMGRLGKLLCLAAVVAAVIYLLLLRAIDYNPAEILGEHVPERRASRDSGHDRSAVVVHLHAPMTAGTTVKRLLQRWALDTRRRLVDAWEEDFLAWDGKRQSEVDVLTSHFGYGVHLQPTYRISKRRPVKYFAFLRDPVERSMAQWRYMMRDEGLEGYSGMLRHQKFMKWWSKQIDMSTAFKLGTGGFSRRQERERMECKGAGVDRHLATQCSPAWMAAANPMTQQLCCWSSNHVRRGGAHERCPQNAATLDCAKANLKSFAFVGLVERMNQSVALMKHTLAMRLGDRRKGQRVPWENPTTIAPLLQATALETRLIMRANPLDQQLYALAVELFEEQWRAAQRQGVRVQPGDQSIPPASRGGPPSRRRH